MKRRLKIKSFIYYIGLFVFLFGLTFTFNYYTSKRHLSESIELSQSNLIRALEPYQKTLQNARWPAQRYEILLRNHQNADEKIVNEIESQMLQLSFGFDYEYFLLRSFGGDTRVEIKGGGLIKQKSTMTIVGQEQFPYLPMGFIVRACNISSSSYLCLIDLPPQRTFVPIIDRNYSVIALPLTEILMQGKNSTYENIMNPRPFIKVLLNNKTIFLSESSMSDKNILNTKQKIDDDFFLEGGYSYADFLKQTIYFAIIFWVFLVTASSLISQYVKKRVKFRLDYAILNKKLEHYNQMQDLIRGVVHDIKSPLAALKALGGFEQDSEKQTLMNHALKRLQMIAGDLEIKRKTVEENDMSLLPLDLMLKIVQLEKAKEYEEFSILYEKSGDNVWIYGSYSEFFRVMSNLINNSIEASEKHSPITIGLRFDSDKVIEIYVRDVGKGIDSDYIDHVFDKGSSFGKKGGTGFGLFQCKTVIESMGGQVYLDSSVNTGTTVRLKLPIVRRPSWAIEKIDLRGFTKVIVIDDETTYRDLWEKKLNGKINYLYYEHPNHVPSSDLQDPGTLTLLDNNFGADYGFGLRFLASNTIANCIVVTAEWTLSDIQKAVENLEVQLTGKDNLDQLEILS